MTTKNQIETALKDAMRSGDEVSKRTLRNVLSAIRLLEIDKGKILDETEIVQVLQKEIKSQQESIVDAERAGRPELAAVASSEITILEKYLPKQLTEAELENMAKEAIVEAGATTPRELGQVMKILMPRVQGRSDGARVNQIVRKLLG
jgi:uncharacterized protein YqeY